MIAYVTIISSRYFLSRTTVHSTRMYNWIVLGKGQVLITSAIKTTTFDRVMRLEENTQ